MTDNFRARLVGVLPDHEFVRNDLLNAAVDEIMKLVREAIETPLVSGEIDTWLVRTMMGKQGTRAEHEGGYEAALAACGRAAEAFWKLAPPAITAAEIGRDNHRVEYAPDPAIEIFARAYQTERICLTAPGNALEHAAAAVARYRALEGVTL